MAYGPFDAYDAYDALSLQQELIRSQVQLSQVQTQAEFGVQFQAIQTFTGTSATTVSGAGGGNGRAYAGQQPINVTYINRTLTEAWDMMNDHGKRIMVNDLVMSYSIEQIQISNPPQELLEAIRIRRDQIIAEQEAAAQAYRQAELERQDRIQKAEAKSIQLLKSWLTPSQLDSYMTNGDFEVKGGTSGDTYRIKTGTVSNVINVSKRQALCFLPQGAYASGDVHLAQKIALENYETETLSVANTYSF